MKSSIAVARMATSYHHQTNGKRHRGDRAPLGYRVGRGREMEKYVNNRRCHGPWAACSGIENTSGKPPAWRPAEPARYASHAKYDLISLNIRPTSTTPPHPPNRLPQLGTASPLPPAPSLPSLDRGTPPLAPMWEHECKPAFPSSRPPVRSPPCPLTFPSGRPSVRSPARPPVFPSGRPSVRLPPRPLAFPSGRRSVRSPACLPASPSSRPPVR